MAQLNVRKSLALGQVTKLNDSGPVTGTSRQFSIPPHSNSEADFSALFQAVGTLGSLSADLEFSMDGGNNFNKLSTAALVAATPFKLVTPILSGGIIWQLNVTAAPTSADFYVAINRFPRTTTPPTTAGVQSLSRDILGAASHGGSQTI